MGDLVERCFAKGLSEMSDLASIYGLTYLRVPHPKGCQKCQKKREISDKCRSNAALASICGLLTDLRVLRQRAVRNVRKTAKFLTNAAQMQLWQAFADF